METPDRASVPFTGRDTATFAAAEQGPQLHSWKVHLGSLCDK
jgi:hypothetical protein